MENQRESKAPKLKSLDGAVPPINVLNFAGGHRYSPAFDPYPSESLSSPSVLVKYVQAADPSSTFNSPVFLTPVKVEEDVIVMDGIPVPKSNKGGGEGRMRLTTSTNSVIGGLVIGRSHSTSSPSSAGSGSGSGRGSGNEQSRYYKNRLCRFWENTGACQFGSGCQFAHGGEELRPPRSSGKIKLETSKLNSNLEGSTPSSYGTKYPPISQVKTPAAAAAAEPLSFPSPPTGMDFPTSPTQVKQLSGSTISSSATANTTPPPPRSDWTPGDDGIEVSVPLGSTEEKNPSKQDVDAYIQKSLCGTKSRKRLPVFVEICPDELVD